MRFIIIPLICIAIISSVGCDSPPGAKGFSLPKGNVAAGKQVFTSMRCDICHSLPGIEQQPLVEDQKISVKLGGEVVHIKTYGELVTSVINPSHRIAKSYVVHHTDDKNQSAMLNYNDIMTVTELIDLISFLESSYTLGPYVPSRYRGYYP